MEMSQYTHKRAVLRICRELAFIKNSKEIAEWGIAIEVVKDNLALLRAQICGPSGTPYEGGNFILEIKIPERYPIEAPKCRFATKIWHPNICSATVQDILAAAQPNDYMDSAVVKEYRKNPEKFRFTARQWTQTYAGAVRSPNDEKTAVVMPKQYEENMQICKSDIQLNDGKADIMNKQLLENSELYKSSIQPGNGQASILSMKYHENSEIPKCNQDDIDFGEMVATFMGLTVDENKIDATSSWNLEKARAMLANLHF